MVYRLNLSEEAKQDINEALVWYSQKEEGLPQTFIADLSERMNYIETQPLLFQITSKGRYREAQLSTFPYVIVFELIKTEIMVYAVFPTKANPKIKYR